jgi:hypothetical protein
MWATALAMFVFAVEVAPHRGLVPVDALMKPFDYFRSPFRTSRPEEEAAPVPETTPPPPFEVNKSGTCALMRKSSMWEQSYVEAVGAADLFVFHRMFGLSLAP